MKKFKFEKLPWFRRMMHRIWGIGALFIWSMPMVTVPEAFLELWYITGPLITFFLILASGYWPQCWHPKLTNLDDLPDFLD